jgi:protein-S-isoprenylcysteine O-methyltransferase Ste14
MCYRTLGGAFSFEVVPSGARSTNPEVVKKPKLAQTGLYSFLRHPSYTTGFSCVIGAAFTPLLAGSWMKESGFLETEVGKVVVPTWLFIFGITIVFVAMRIEGEDEVMKRQFGEEWLQWSRRVRYKLIPGVY